MRIVDLTLPIAADYPFRPITVHRLTRILAVSHDEAAPPAAAVPC